MSSQTAAKAHITNFIRNIIDADLASGKVKSVVTRFPPEPNGYLHVGHAKSICLNFGLARDYGGRCHMRFDDTNPVKEDIEYVESILDSVKWLGFDWAEHLYYASDYFEKIYEFSEHLIKNGKAYVDSLTAEETRELRGTLTEGGKESPYRNRSVDENLDLFRGMRAGRFPDGAHVLRAKIDMNSPNINLRDPVLWRIRHAHHHRQGDKWCIYPMYDFTHAISDALEHITHSICTLEFEDHRPLYDWSVEGLPVPSLSSSRPYQYEFARLNLSYTVLSKRKLIELVEGGFVDGWDDPRMPTLVGLRRRGYTPEGIRLFCDRIGVSKADSWIDVSVLEECIREDLEQRAPRRIAVLNALKLIIDNYPQGQSEECFAPNDPNKPELGKRSVPFAREIWIERDDFMENPPKGYFRLVPGGEVRLRYGYIIKCVSVDKDAAGNVTAVHCIYDPQTKSGSGTEQRKVKGAIHWLAAAHAQQFEVRLYDRLFLVEAPGTARDYKEDINPNSKTIITAYGEAALGEANPKQQFQFERIGYFVADSKDSKPGKPVFNRTVGLKDSWAKEKAKA
jgi:glutaminyl-tRNA synthetase